MQKRSFPRRCLHADTILKTRQGVLAGRAENISIGGVYAKLHGPLVIGEKTEVTISMASAGMAGNVVVNGIAVRIEEGGVALRFCNVDHQTFYALLSYIYLPDPA